MSDHLWSLVSLPPPQEGSIIKHVLGQRVQRPEVPFSRVSRFSWYLDEAIIERQVVSDGVLPLGELLLVVRKSLLYKLTDPTESQPLVRSLEDCHGDHCYVGVRRLHSLGLLVFLLILAVMIALAITHSLSLLSFLSLEFYLVLREESVHLDCFESPRPPRPANLPQSPQSPVLAEIPL